VARFVIAVVIMPFELVGNTCPSSFWTSQKRREMLKTSSLNLYAGSVNE
jgi:hypothetical protein